MSENGDEFTLKFEDESDTSAQYADSIDQDTSQVSASEDVPTQETQQDSTPKILVQRVFHQPEKHVVEQKLDYVIANSEEEITKHVYGGLFRNKYYKYSPESYCQKHAPDLHEHEDETLVKLGDKFDSLESFRLYIDGKAKQWKYYLKCADSHRQNGKECFVFKCVFARQRSKHLTAKGIRKRTFPLPRGDCPCRVILKPVPFDAKDYTVIYVCNHHDHPLTDDYFYKLQHGRRIHPSIKEELMDLLSLEVDREVVKKYFESLTGYSMSCTFFQNMIISMKKNKIERKFSLEKLKEMSKKIEKIKEEMGIVDEEENVDNDLLCDDNVKKDKASQVAEAFQVLKAVSAPKKNPQKQRMRSNSELEPTIRKKPKKQQELCEERMIVLPEGIDNRSRLETRLQELTFDRETLQNVKHLQDSVRCEAEHNPWVGENVVDESHERVSLESEAKSVRDSQNESSNITNSAIVIENNQESVAYVDNQEIIYGNEITVMDTTAENCPENIVNCVNIAKNEGMDLNENNVSYCIQYEDDEGEGDQSQQQFILMLDDVESFENLPEVQIQATEMATVSIMSENNQNNMSIQNAVQNFANADEVCNDINDSQSDLQAADQSQIPESCGDGMESTVYEVIQTNDRKIFPSREIVQSVILNKPPKTEVRRANSRNESQSRDKSKKNDSSLQNLRKSERYMTKVFKKDLEDLDDNECYMIVVNDEESGEQDNNIEKMNGEVENEESEFQDSVCSQTVTSYYIDNDSYSHEVSIEAENIKNVEPEQSEDNVGYLLEQARLNEEIESKDSINKALDEKRIQNEKELLELHEAITILKNKKIALEQDIEHLTATKDDLIEDITKASRLSRRIFKSTK